MRSKKLKLYNYSLKELNVMLTNPAISNDMRDSINNQIQYLTVKNQELLDGLLKGRFLIKRLAAWELYRENKVKMDDDGLRNKTLTCGSELDGHQLDDGVYFIQMFLMMFDVTERLNIHQIDVKELKWS